MIGLTDYDMPWSEDADNIRKIDEKVLKARSTVVSEEHSRTASGKDAIWLSRKEPFYDKRNNIIGIIGISVDITDLKNTQSDLEKAKVNAEVASRAKSEFLRNMEHQLRTPFSGIYSLVEFLAETEGDPERKEMLALTSQSAKELLDLLNLIIDFSRNEVNSQIVVAKKFDLKKTIQKAVTMEKAAAIAKGLELSFDYPDIPSIYIGDPYRIKRIVLNLLSNAITFTQKGKVHVAVELAKELDNRQAILKISVTDTGIGIPKDKQELIYEKFYRIHPANQNIYVGAGLGLHVVKQLIDDLQGEIDVISELNKGTSFICTLLFSRPLLDEVINDDND